MSTIPRIKFDQRGFCSACVLDDKIDWKERQEELEKLSHNA